MLICECSLSPVKEDCLSKGTQTQLANCILLNIALENLQLLVDIFFSFLLSSHLNFIYSNIEMKTIRKRASEVFFR